MMMLLAHPFVLPRLRRPNIALYRDKIPIS
ncbi:hypothetical protein PAE9249_03798 [Paenibacillus sp. CECT 9249]|nr:hypothetical protein PAE9249_03798 [Paenibacillus sp. CECT 9249]